MTMTLLLVLAAIAGEPTPADQAKPEKPKLICREEIPTGTRFPKKVCETPEEAKRRVEGSRRSFDEMQNRRVFKMDRGI